MRLFRRRCRLRKHQSTLCPNVDFYVAPSAILSVLHQLFKHDDIVSGLNFPLSRAEEHTVGWMSKSIALASASIFM